LEVKVTMQLTVGNGESVVALFGRRNVGTVPDFRILIVVDPAKILPNNQARKCIVIMK